VETSSALGFQSAGKFLQVKRFAQKSKRLEIRAQKSGSGGKLLVFDSAFDQ
jgi:hypothetical protein